MKNFAPKNCIFAVTHYDYKDRNDWYLAITPKAYWDKEQCCYDQHFGFTVPVPFDDFQEGCFDGSSNDPQKLYEEAISYGFVWDLDLNVWLKSLGNVVHFPTTSAPKVSQKPVVDPTRLTGYELEIAGFQAVKPGHQNTLQYFGITGKIDTEVLKRVIVEIIVGNPGCIASIFKDKNALILEACATAPKEWKRTSKMKTNEGWERIFSCEAYQGRLRAYIYTDKIDKNLVKIFLKGE